jgi:ATP-dependent Lhr-like helicase
VQMRRMLPESVLEEVGGLDPAAIAQVREEAWPDVRDADELHDVLHTLVALPAGRALLDRTAEGGCPHMGIAGNNWLGHFERLVGEGRAASAVCGNRIYWVAAERARSFSALFPEARFAQALTEVEATAPTRDDALFTLVTGWMSHLGPVTAMQLGEILGVPASGISNALLRMEASGTVLRGNFSGTAVELRSAGQPGAAAPTQATETEWCERRLLARIHRLTVASLRKQIEPVTAAQFMQWLLRWQHVAAGTQVAGERGTLEVLRQLQGFEIPANAWERQVLARRIVDYDPKWLDQLCLTGAVGWGRLSPHPATLDYSNASRGTEAESSAAPRQRRVIPTSVAPITFFIREDADWMTPRHPGAERTGNSVLENGLSYGAQTVLDFLRQRGASFFADIVRGTGKLKAEIETALWELVAAGLVTADGFDNLRSLIDPKRRAGQGSGRTTRPRHNAGRWALLHSDEVVERPRAVEAACWMLLRRYGIVVRDVLAREANLPPWRELLAGFRRLEDRGEIRGGRFVDGFLGEQFALPVAVDSVRALRKLDAAQETITLSAADPLNLVGILVPGERVPAISGNSVTYRDGAAALPIAVASSEYRAETA